MKGKQSKTIFVILGIVAFAVIFSLINKYYLKNNYAISEDVYKNEISKIVDKNNDVSIEEISYDKLMKDLNDIDTILKEQISSDIDLKKKTSYYKVAINVYQNKLNEILRILNTKLDDEDFGRLQVDLDEFNKNIEYATDDFNNTLESTVDIDYYTNKYIYEEMQSKCHEIIDTYKGFLK